jgi:hypothetical protein
MSLRPGKLPFLGSEDEFLDHRGFRMSSMRSTLSKPGEARAKPGMA